MKLTRGKLALAGATALVAVVAAASAMAVAQSPPRSAGYSPWAPGAYAPVSALQRLPVVAQPPAGVLSAVSRAAEATGGDPATAVATLRILRRDLGAGRSDLYAYTPGGRGPGHATCFVLSQRSGTCPTVAESPTPGVDWHISGGYSSAVDPAHADIPSALLGIAADNVRAVELVQAGRAAALPIVNNAFYVDLATPEAGSTWSAQLRVTYRSGTQRTVDLPDFRS